MNNSKRVDIKFIVNFYKHKRIYIYVTMYIYIYIYQRICI